LEKNYGLLDGEKVHGAKKLANTDVNTKNQLPMDTAKMKTMCIENTALSTKI